MTRLSVLLFCALWSSLLNAQTAEDPRNRQMRTSGMHREERPGWRGRTPKPRGPRDDDPAWTAAVGSGGSSSTSGLPAAGGPEDSSGELIDSTRTSGTSTAHRAPVNGRQHYTTPEPSAYIEMALVGAALLFFGWKRKRASSTSSAQG